MHLLRSNGTSGNFALESLAVTAAVETRDQNRILIQFSNNTVLSKSIALSVIRERS
jgi:hypothetical protein